MIISVSVLGVTGHKKEEQNSVIHCTEANGNIVKAMGIRQESVYKTYKASPRDENCMCLAVSTVVKKKRYSAL
jgi:hypothetical protein